MDEQTITGRIDAILRQRGIAKHDFYTACGISSAAYSQWNTGKTVPRASSLRRVADFLHVNYAYLATGQGEMETTPPETQERPISDQDIKFALFGGADDITDAMYDEVKQFARMVMLREEAEKRRQDL